MEPMAEDRHRVSCRETESQTRQWHTWPFVLIALVLCIAVGCVAFGKISSTEPEEELSDPQTAQGESASSDDQLDAQLADQAEPRAEIVIAGDLCFAEDGFVLDHFDEVGELNEVISPEILDITNGADLFFLNHEYAISDRGEPLDGKYYTFRADPERMELLEEMGTDLVSLANNHVYDYGPQALLDTADLLDQAEIPYVGGGRNIEEAKRPAYFDVNGIKIGFVAASNAEKIRYTPQAEEDSPGVLLAYDTTEFNQVIRDASGECDFLIAYIHWGDEDTNDYNDLQQELGREFLDSGADIVIGGHPHVLQGMEYVDGKPIVYSMGDFWFNDETKYTGLLKLIVGPDGLEEMSFVPCMQESYETHYLSEASDQAELFEFLEGLSPNIKIDENGSISEKA